MARTTRAEAETTDPVVDVDPVAIALAELASATEVLAEYGPDGAAHVSGLNEGPYPHLQIRPSPGGDDNRLLWSVTGEVALLAWAHPDGRPGSAELRRLLYRAVKHLVGTADRESIPGRPVVVDAYAVGSARLQPDPATGQLCWAHTVQIIAHPDNA
ncbi:hypothetical protein ABZ671_18575 [Micromonospora sp. NPDC006766]|uniref:hypothetical protein n=1 Tax=Micromonospora sp. NPDC006766 TaxID=3154778 RepID=UPI0033CD8641